MREVLMREMCHPCLGRGCQYCIEGWRYFWMDALESRVPATEFEKLLGREE